MTLSAQELFDKQREQFPYIYAGIEHAERFLAEGSRFLTDKDEDTILDLYRDFLLSQDLCDDIEL